MVKIRCLIWTMTFLFFFSPYCHAEMYQYVDKNGVLSFTDDLSRLSSKQRKKIVQLPEYKSLLKDARRLDGHTQRAPGPTGGAPKSRALDDALQNEARRLDDVKRSLDLDYNQILEERQRLTKLGEQLKRNGDIAPTILENYRVQVNALNKRTITYETQLKIYQERVQNFNKSAGR